MNPDLSVVIPAYNEASRIERALLRAVDFLSERGAAFEMVIVDDGSVDHTALIARQFIGKHPGQAIRVVALQSNQGKGAALRAGVAATRGRRVLLMDADLATPIAELDKLSQALDRGAAVAIGSRALATSAVLRAQSPLRTFFGWAGSLWVRALALPDVHDTQCGFKLFDGDVARTLFAAARQNRFGIDIEILCLARLRFRLLVAEVGVRWEHQDGSKVRWRDYLDVLVQVPKIIWRVKTGG
jgi:dolichyl-phosphate beta-glucosyltransferase